MAVAAANLTAAVDVSREGLRSLHERFVWRRRGGRAAVGWVGRQRARGDGHLRGDWSRRTAQRLLRALSGQATGRRDLHRQLDDWVARGIAEPTFADAVRAVMANPNGWMPGDLQIVVIGAGSEMGPCGSCWTGVRNVHAVDLPNSATWERVMATGKDSAGRLAVPVPRGPPTSTARPTRGSRNWPGWMS